MARKLIFCRPLFLIFGALLNPTTSTERKRINSYAGPYITQVTRFYRCDKIIADRLHWNFSMRFSHINPANPKQLQHASGFFTGTAPINDTWWLQLILDSWSNNQWKENEFRFVFPKEGCTAMFRQASWSKVIVGNLLKQLKPCVIVPGTNIFNDTPIEFAFPNFPIMPYIKWRGRLSMNVVGLTHPALCMFGEGTIVPKI